MHQGEPWRLSRLRFFPYLYGHTIVSLDHVASSLEEGKVLDLGGVHQYLVPISIFTVLTGDYPLPVLVGVKKVAVDRHLLGLPKDAFV